MSQLPPGWAPTTVRDLGLWAGGSTPSKSKPEYWDNGMIPWVSPKDMKTAHLEGSQDHVTQAALDQTSLRLIPTDSVAVVVRSGILERTIPVARIPFPATLNQDMKAVSPHPGLDARWVLYALMSQERDFLKKCRKSGTTVASLETNALMAMPMLVPPTAEQVRIVTAIEEAFSLLDAGEAGLHETRSRLKRMRDSVLAAAVTGQLVLQDPTDTPAERLLRELGIEALGDVQDLPPVPEAWRWATLAKVAEVVGGVTKDAKRQNDPGSVEVPYLRVANVQRGYLDLTTVTTIRVPRSKAEQLTLRPGDVLFNEGGDRDKLGRGWVWEGQVADCIHQNHVYRARLATGLEPKLVSWWGNTFGRVWFEFHGKQTTNLASINLTTLKAFPVPVPPPEEQSRIVAEVDRQFSFIEAAERAVDAALVRAAGLRRSVLRAAFEGRLVPQDPSDEPATVLLERIAAERAAAPEVSRRGRAKVDAS